MADSERFLERPAAAGWRLETIYLNYCFGKRMSQG
jgi:hypothetical protein